MPDLRFPRPDRVLDRRRRALVPEAEDAFHAFSKAVFAEGSLDALDIFDDPAQDDGA